MRMFGKYLVYDFYERRLASSVRKSKVPRHVGVILDGNRRWAREYGAPAAHGHQRGADKIGDLLRWAQDMGVELVTLWMLSTENLHRDEHEISDLLEIIVRTVERLAAAGVWRLRLVGAKDLLPKVMGERLQTAIDASQATGGMAVNVAIGYGGRHEITDAVRAHLLECAQRGESLEEVAGSLDVEDIGRHLYTSGQPDPDLVIRTSGEQRLSGFMLWQSVHSEYYFCEAYWPDFRRIDFLRALRAYSLRERRLGK